MKGKIFTLDEANRMLPLVRRIADDIVATYGKVHGALQALEAEKARFDPDVPSPASTPEDDRRLRELDEEVSILLDRFQGLIEEIEALGGTVKDYERGCIDFYGEVDGEIVYFCWQRGETSVAHWHRLEDGFAKRKPLSVPSAA